MRYDSAVQGYADHCYAAALGYGEDQEEFMESKTDGGIGDICVAVATHKAYRMPTDSIYLPVQVGKALHPDLDLGFTTDDTGDNISAKNNWYSELTGLYWLWKNVDAEYKGLVHYRRHFGTTKLALRFDTDRFNRIIGDDELRALLKSTDIIVPKRRHYYIETIYSHYAHTFDAQQFDELRDILRQSHSGYVDAFDQVMSSRSAHLFNMFIMRSQRLDEYCSWLFPILFELEKRIAPQLYDAFGARYLGRVSERLLDVWLKTNRYDYIELPAVSPEHVQWRRKGGAFLLAKLGVRKYKGSF